MCLYAPLKIPARYKNGGFGYKVVEKVTDRKSKGKYRPVYFNLDSYYAKRGTYSVALPSKQDLNGMIRSISSRTSTGLADYPYGFHVYTTIKAARSACNTEHNYYHTNAVIVRVKFKNVVAFGKDNNSKNNTVVAREMAIVKEIK